MADLYQVGMPYYCAGIYVASGRIVKAAPICKWMVGKSLSEVRDWVARKGGSVTEVHAHN